MEENNDVQGVPAKKPSRAPALTGPNAPALAAGQTPAPGNAWHHPAEKSALTRRRKRSAEIDLTLQLQWGDGGAHGDDFTVRTEDGYVLRVEQMDYSAWWWQVYFPDGTEADPWCSLSVETEYIAKRLCELVYKLHSRNTEL